MEKINDTESTYYPEDSDVWLNGKVIHLPMAPIPIDVIIEIYRELHNEAFGYDGDTTGFKVSVSPEFAIPSGIVIRQVVLEDARGIIIHTVIKEEN